MGIHGSQGTKVYIGGVAPAGDVSAIAYAALSWVEIKDIETFSGLKKSSNDVNFTPLSGDEETRKGARKAVEAMITCGRNPIDPGQIAADAAEASRFKYAFKVTFEDAEDGNDTDSVVYWKALVMDSGPSNVGGGNDMTKREFRLRGKSADIFEDPSTAVS